jgi:hypothetical protein
LGNIRCLGYLGRMGNLNRKRFIRCMGHGIALEQ